MIGSGIFSTPGVVYSNVNSIGATICIFILGAVVSACGLYAYVELGTMRPVSGGEKEYLDYACKGDRFSNIQHYP
jgi:L-type amino acid transporter 9